MAMYIEEYHRVLCETTFTFRSLLDFYSRSDQ